MSKEAMKLALEALETLMLERGSIYDKAITALREALAEQPAQQEPVATLWQHGETGRTRITMPGDITDCDARWFKAADLFTSPQAQRTWVGLTNKDIYECEPKNDWYCSVEFAQAIEAKLKEKNT